VPQGISDGEKQELDDGSVIFGKTTFAKDDGTLGEVADVALKYKLHTKERLVYYYIKVQKIYNDKIMKSILL
jgi:hypothetical protein